MKKFRKKGEEKRHLPDTPSHPSTVKLLLLLDKFRRQIPNRLISMNFCQINNMNDI